jgi:hypothetical protein
MRVLIRGPLVGYLDVSGGKRELEEIAKNYVIAAFHKILLE